MSECRIDGEGRCSTHPSSTIWNGLCRSAAAALQARALDFEEMYARTKLERDEAEARVRELEAMWQAKSEVGDARIARAERAVGRLKNLPKIVCLCGSTRFKDEFVAANLRETLAGKIVLSIGCDLRSDAELFGGMNSEEWQRTKMALDMLHFLKIQLADEILILNCGGYIGESTRRELNHAISLGKTIRWLEPDAALAEAEGDK